VLFPLFIQLHDIQYHLLDGCVELWINHKRLVRLENEVKLQVNQTIYNKYNCRQLAIFHFNNCFEWYSQLVKLLCSFQQMIAVRRWLSDLVRDRESTMDCKCTSQFPFADFEFNRLFLQCHFTRDNLEHYMHFYFI
jgi:hypothetical protein